MGVLHRTHVELQLPTCPWLRTAAPRTHRVTGLQLPAPPAGLQLSLPLPYATPHLLPSYPPPRSPQRFQFPALPAPSALRLPAPPNTQLLELSVTRCAPPTSPPTPRNSAPPGSPSAARSHHHAGTRLRAPLRTAQCPPSTDTAPPRVSTATAPPSAEDGPRLEAQFPKAPWCCSAPPAPTPSPPNPRPHVPRL